MNTQTKHKYMKSPSGVLAFLLFILLTLISSCGEDKGVGIDLEEQLYLENEIPQGIGTSSSNPFATPDYSSGGVSSAVNFPGSGGPGSPPTSSSSSYSFGVPGSSVYTPGISSSAPVLQDSLYYYSTYFSPENCQGMLCSAENYGDDWNYSVPINGYLPNFSSTSFNNVKVVSGSQDMSGITNNLQAIENFSWSAAEISPFTGNQENYVTGRFTWSGGNKDFRNCEIDFRYYKGAHITISGTGTIMDGVFWVDMTDEPRFLMVDTSSAYAIEWY